MGDNRLQEVIGWIRDARCTGIGHQSNAVLSLQQGQQMRCLPRLIMVPITAERTGNTMMGQQLAGVPRILRRNHINAAQNAQGAQRDILKIPNGCRHDV